jgi:hypothetical protein
MQNGVTDPTTENTADRDTSAGRQQIEPGFRGSTEHKGPPAAEQLTVFVVGREAVLLQEVVLQEARRLQRDLVRLRQRVLQF